MPDEQRNVGVSSAIFGLAHRDLFWPDDDVLEWALFSPAAFAAEYLAMKESRAYFRDCHYRDLAELCHNKAGVYIPCLRLRG